MSVKRGMSRRDFLKLAGIGLLTATLRLKVYSVTDEDEDVNACCWDSGRDGCACDSNMKRLPYMKPHPSCADDCPNIVKFHTSHTVLGTGGMPCGVNPSDCPVFRYIGGFPFTAPGQIISLGSRPQRDEDEV